VILSPCLGLACGSEPLPTVDAGFADAAVDAGPADSGVVDAGPLRVQLNLDFRGDGLGRVLSTPAGVDCNDDCITDFEPGTSLTLTASAADDVVFVGWTAPGCGVEPTCTVTLQQDLQISVKFSRFFTLTIEPLGDGLGVVDVEGGERCNGSCDIPVLSDTMVVLHAVAAAGVEFVGWSGVCNGPDPECRIGINGPKFVRPLFEVKTPQIDGGDAHFCGLLWPDTLRCWGRGDQGQLGGQSNESIGDDEPVRDQGTIPLGFDVMQVDVGGAHSCVLGRQGQVRCWGDNSEGQLGQDSVQSVGGAGQASPAQASDVDLGGPALQVAAGGQHTCALMQTGAVRCWGRGLEGQLGYGDRQRVSDGSGPSVRDAGEVDLGAPATFIAAGGQHTCAVLVGGELKCWGSNARGQLGYAFGGNAGDGTSGRARPSDLEALALGAPVSFAKLGPVNSCVRYDDRRIRCWGANDSGQLGDGDSQQVGGQGGLGIDTAIDVLLGINRVVNFTVGAEHACALLQDGSVRCWGSGQAGATGYESVMDESTPLGAVTLINGHRPTVLAAAGRSTCAATRFGSGRLDVAMLCWGSGQHGVLGTGDTANVGDRAGTTLFRSLRVDGLLSTG